MDRLARNLDDLRRIVQGLTGRGVRVEFGDAGLEGSAARALGIGRSHTAAVRGRGMRFLPT
jgi:DNA invertase Pin-like site-specific DNA recombinase